MKKIAVIGSGSWGTALAIVLADHHIEVAMYSRREEQVNEINDKHTNARYLPGVTFSQRIRAYTDYAQVLSNCELILIVLPTASIRLALQQMIPYIQKKATFIHASKGLEPETYERISQMIEQEVPAHLCAGIVALSGPSHAEEVSLRAPTTVVASSLDMKQAELVQDLFINENFRVYTHADLIGVELGGALKNIIALGAGLSDGLGYGDNAKAAFMTRGLAEMSRLGVNLGAHPLTFSGLTGIGDLFVTCASKHSRNWRCGYEIGQGRALSNVLESMGMVVEGVRTTKAAYQLSKAKGVPMPITHELHAVLFERKSAIRAVEDLMSRGKTREMESTLLGSFEADK